jgi:GTPase
MTDNITDSEFRCGYVALIGKPNVGKSTLSNALLGQKLSIVTAKPQTTRRRVLGILSSDNYQAVVLDTPGVIEPRYGLQKAMMNDVRASVADADILVFMADATQDSLDIRSMEYLIDRPSILVINKSDLVPGSQMLPIVEAYASTYPFEEIIPVSALKKRNVDTLLSAVVNRLPIGPAFYPPDMISEHPERFFVAEIIREKIFQQFRQEIPYSTTVTIVQYDEKMTERDRIEAEIIVERSSQKGILIGKGGAALKKVGIAARRDIEELLQRNIYLGLHVKVRADWRNNDTLLKEFGYQD